jgi:uncharacterized membrane protein YfcA
VPDAWQLVITLFIGLGTGVLSGMFGVGGAILSTPAIRALGVSPLDAVGTTLPSMLPSSISGTLRYNREGLIRWPVVALVAPIGSVATIGGSLLSHLVPGDGHPLMIATAVLVGFTAWRMARARDEPESPVPEAAPDGVEHRGPGERAKLVATGLAAGLLSGLLGVGGGILMVPAVAEWIGFSVKESVGTSLACVGILAIPATITHAFLGDINWWYAVALSIGVIPGARIGAHLAIRASERGFRLSVAVVLGSIAVVYGLGELIALA